MNILLMVSALNGLSQRALCAVQRAGHEVTVHIAKNADDMRAAAAMTSPDLILCPFLKAKVPEDVWQRWLTIIIHPGPVGDRGPSSLDWAIADAETRWGVTALQAIEEMDAGPIWASSTFDMPNPPQRKSALYNSLVADSAMQCVDEVLAHAQDPLYTPVPQDLADRPIPSSRLRPPMTQAIRAVSWDESTMRILRMIRAADGSPGLRTELAGLPVYAYDAHAGDHYELAEHPGHSNPGDVLCHHDGAVHVRTGDGTIWIGHLRQVPGNPEKSGIKLPAATVLGDRLGPPAPPAHRRSHRDIRYRREVAFSWLTFDFYNGAMSTRQCQRLLAALRHAVAERPPVLVVTGSSEVFSNGIHLNVIEAAENPAREAWENIKAINAVCRELLTAPMPVITAFSGNAGAGGVMLGLAGDAVVARDGVILNPYYDIGLTGSELHTYTLPRRVGTDTAKWLLEQRQPVDTAQALHLGMVDAVGPRDPEEFSRWLAGLARHHATVPAAPGGGPSHVPLDAIEIRELAKMSYDMFEDLHGFAAARHAFVHKLPRGQHQTPALSVAAP